MYFFYFDESGSRDPSLGTAAKPKDHLYVLLAVGMKHARFQRAGNRNMEFPAIVEYPFFTRSELSNGVQLADLLAYSVYRAFRHEDFGYPYFERVLCNFYRRPDGAALDGLKVWPEASPLVRAATDAWDAQKQKALRKEGG